MALSDFTQQLNANEISLSTKQAQAGSQSLRFSSADNDKLITNDKPEADAPTEGRLVTYLYMTDNGVHNEVGIAARYQDTNNFYAIIINSQDARFKLGYIDGGTFTEAVSFSDFNINTQDSQWNKWRFSFWEDSNGDFTARIEQEQSGTWVQAGGDLTEDGVSKFSGGGIGLTALPDSNNQNQSELFFDETEFLY